MRKACLVVYFAYRRSEMEGVSHLCNMIEYSCFYFFVISHTLSFLCCIFAFDMEEQGNIRYTFSKREKLCSEKTIGRMFSDGVSFVKFPLRVIYLVEELADGEEPICQVLTSVPKKRFKRAVKRNRIKRLMREAYRLNKHILVSANTSKRISLSFIMLDDKEPSFFQVQKAVVKSLERVANAL